MALIGRLAECAGDVWELRRMAVLPARPAFTLDTLVARARAVRSAPATRSSPTPARPKTPAELEAAPRLSSAAAEPATPLILNPPVAVALWITIRRCACGTVTRCPPDYALLKYTPNAHSIHWSRADLNDYAHLPRELREKEVAIPFCEACFAPSND